MEITPMTNDVSSVVRGRAGCFDEYGFRKRLSKPVTRSAYGGAAVVPFSAQRTTMVGKIT